MTLSLPERPSLEHLRKQAKDILKAQRHGDATGWEVLRRLHRCADLADADILAARITLKEAQFALAVEYGFKSWDAMRRFVRSHGMSDAATLEAVVLRCELEIPEYAGAGVALGVTAALNHAGVDIDYMTFAAATGWAFSFGYRYEEISPAFMAVRGNPKANGPFEVFAFLPTRLGLDYDLAPTQEPDKLWPFVIRYVDAGVPIMSEHIDGGLITGYREHVGNRQIYFDGTVGRGWTNIADLHPFEVAVFVKSGDPLPWDQITRDALEHAVRKGSAHEAHGAPQGMAALEAYLADVRDPSKDFADVGEWFCWAAFERLMARKCAAVWLDRIAGELPAAAAKHVRTASRHYSQAFERYDEYRSEVNGGEPSPLTVEQRARMPERIAVIGPLLEEGVACETAGLKSLRNAVAALG